MEITDGVHWAEQYMRDAPKAFHMGKASRANGSFATVCFRPDDGQQEAECKEVWLSGSKVEFRVPGSGMPPFDGILQNRSRVVNGLS